MHNSMLYLSVYDPYVPLTGAGARGRQFVGQLARRFDLDLVYLDGSGQPPIPELSRQFAGSIDGIRAEVRIPFSQLDYFTFSRALYRQAWRLLETNRYDLLVCDYGLAGLYGLLLARRFQVPLVYCSHNVEHLMYRDRAPRDRRRLLLIPYVYLVERLAVASCTVLVPISTDDARYFARWTTTKKMIVVPQGFDETVFHPFYERPRNQQRIVLYCGNYGNQFNRDVVHLVARRLLPEVLAAYPDVRFRFVGANPPTDLHHPNLEFTGFVSDYSPLLKQADAVISTRQQQRGFPTKIIESLACGKPTVATPIGAGSIEKDYHSLHVAELDHFGPMLIDVLRRGEPVTAVDFDRLKRHYSWTQQLGRLADRLAATARSARPAGA